MNEYRLDIHFAVIVFLLPRRVEWCITLPWKAMLKIRPQVTVMTWSEKVMLHINQFVSSSWTHPWCFHRSSWSLSKVIPENCWWPSITWNDLGDMTRGHRSQYSDSGCQVYLYPMLSVSNGFPKGVPFIFLPCLIPTGEVAKLTWPWVTDIKIPRYTFNRYCSGYQSLKVFKMISHSA